MSEAVLPGTQGQWLMLGNSCFPVLDILQQVKNPPSLCLVVKKMRQVLLIPVMYHSNRSSVLWQHFTEFSGFISSVIIFVLSGNLDRVIVGSSASVRYSLYSPEFCILFYTSSLVFISCHLLCLSILLSGASIIYECDVLHSS